MGVELGICLVRGSHRAHKCALALCLRHAFAAALLPPADPNMLHRTHMCALDTMWDSQLMW